MIGERAHIATPEGQLRAQADETVRHAPPAVEAERSRIQWEIETYLENMTTAELREWALAGRAIVTRRS